MGSRMTEAEERDALRHDLDCLAEYARKVVADPTESKMYVLSVLACMAQRRWS